MIRFTRHFAELTKPAADSVIRVSAQKQKSLDNSGFYSSSETAIDPRDNPTLSQVLASKRVSVKDPGLHITAVDMELAQTLGHDLLKADLGEVKTYAPHQVLLEDVDPYNLPKDKEIIFTAQTAKVTAIGRLVSGADAHGEGRLDSQVFVERATKDVWTWKDYIKLLPFVPVGYFLALYLQAVREHYQVASYYRALDREDIELLALIKNLPKSVVETVETLERYFPNQA
jgi:hypothetical protein